MAHILYEALVEFYLKHFRYGECLTKYKENNF